MKFCRWAGKNTASTFGAFWHLDRCPGMKWCSLPKSLRLELAAARLLPRGRCTRRITEDEGEWHQCLWWFDFCNFIRLFLQDHCRYIFFVSYESYFFHPLGRLQADNGFLEGVILSKTVILQLMVPHTAFPWVWGKRVSKAAAWSAVCSHCAPSPPRPHPGPRSESVRRHGPVFACCTTCQDVH